MAPYYCCSSTTWVCCRKSAKWKLFSLQIFPGAHVGRLRVRLPECTRVLSASKFLGHTQIWLTCTAQLSAAHLRVKYNQIRLLCVFNKNFSCREWVMFLFNLPMVLWLFYEQQRQRRDSLGVYDPVDIHSRGLLKVHLRNCMIYLGYYFIMFFVGLYL